MSTSESGSPPVQTTAQPRQSRFSRLVTRIGGVFLAPDATFSQVISQRLGFLEPLTLFLLLVAVQTAVMASFLYRAMAAFADLLGSVMGGSYLGLVNVGLFFMFVAVIISALVFWPILTLVAHISARYVFKGRGSFSQLMKLYGYSVIPLSLHILGMVLFGISWALWPVMVFLHVVTVFWIVILMSVAVRQNYSLDTGKAFISAFVGPMTVWLIIVLIFWAWMWLIISATVGGMV